MRIALCNEVLAPMPFPQQCEYAAKLGYEGLELAPYTLSEEPHRISAAQVAATRSAAEASGVAITGLHWLLVKPQGLSITARDAAVRRRTLEVMLALVELCAELGGRYLVHGSGQQRRIEAGDSRAARMEQEPLAALAERWLPRGLIAHVQLNDRNRRGPGQGEQRFAPLFAALARHGYAGDVAVEPFDYVPDGPGAAARAIGYIKGILEALH